MTFNVVCGRSRRLDGHDYERCVGRVRHLDARLLWLPVVRRGSVRAKAGGHNEANKNGRFEANDLAFERNTPSTDGLELMDGGGDSHLGCRSSKRPRTNLEREEHVRDELLVLDLCGNGHCDPDGVVGRTVCESLWSDD